MSVTDITLAFKNPQMVWHLSDFINGKLCILMSNSYFKICVLALYSSGSFVQKVWPGKEKTMTGTMLLGGKVHLGHMNSTGLHWLMSWHSLESRGSPQCTWVRLSRLPDLLIPANSDSTESVKRVNEIHRFCWIQLLHLRTEDNLEMTKKLTIY